MRLPRRFAPRNDYLSKSLTIVGVAAILLTLNFLLRIFKLILGYFLINTNSVPFFLKPQISFAVKERTE
jgi:hypothetical protein